MFTVSLVTYGQRTEDLLPLIDAVLGEGPDRFFVIDHSPRPSGCAGLAARYPGIAYVPEDNRGFGAGHNVALREAQRAGADFHIIVNPDVSFVTGTIRRIVAHMASNPRIGLLMPKTLNPDGSLQYNCKLLPTPLDLFGRRFLPKAWMRRRMETFELHAVDPDCERRVPYLCGCFLAFRLEALREIGLFDERFFMYPEDIDISRRMYASRFESVCWPGAEVTHAHAAASYRNLRMLGVHCWNVVKYFNKWGWFLDAGRRRINREVLRELQEAS